MSIRFEVCPYHEPHPAGFERTLVVDEFTRKFKCAACDAEGFLDAEDQLPQLPQFFTEEFWKSHDKAQAELTPTQKRFGEEPDSRPLNERLFGKEKDNAKA